MRVWGGHSWGTPEHQNIRRERLLPRRGHWSQPWPKASFGLTLGRIKPPLGASCVRGVHVVGWVCVGGGGGSGDPKAPE